MPSSTPKQRKAAFKTNVTDKKDCFYYLVIYVVLLILNFAAHRAAPEMWPLTAAFAVWCLWLPYRVVRDYRRIRKTGKSLLVSPAERLRDAYHIERWNVIVVSCLALLGSVSVGISLMELFSTPDINAAMDAAYKSAMTDTSLCILASFWLLPACFGISAWSARKKYQKAAQETVGVAGIVEPESAIVDAPKHWWTSNDVREDKETRQKVGRGE